MDIALLTYPIDTNPAGVGVHVENIVKNILSLDTRNTYHLLHFTESDHPIYTHNETLYRQYKHLPFMFSDSRYLAKHGHRYDIVHRFLPGGFISRIPSKIVITVHDLFQYKWYPFNRSLKLLFARFINRQSLMKADALLAVSEFTKKEILDTFAIDADRVHVVYGAPRGFQPNPEKSREMLNAQYDLSSPYILFVSTIEPRKNLLTLVKAFEALKERYSIDEALVIVGRRGWNYEETLRYIEKSDYRESIKEIGFVPTTHLGYFYEHAKLFVYPSFMEGFGIPPLEAMACGCPTLTSDTSSLPEVVNDRDMMFPPDDIEVFTAKMLKILRDPVARKDNIAKGIENAKRFSWKRSAEKVIGIYNNLGEREEPAKRR